MRIFSRRVPILLVLLVVLSLGLLLLGSSPARPLTQPSTPVTSTPVTISQNGSNQLYLPSVNDGSRSGPVETPFIPTTPVFYSVSGYVQKGPFIQGTELTIRELDSNLNPTGRTFAATIDSNSGSFTVRGTLAYPFIELSANGYYFNEVTGVLSNSPLTLQALVDLRNGGSVNVNPLTYLERDRVLNLVDNGANFADAKQQAQQEILAAFNIGSNSIGASETLDISDSGEGNAILLAISTILQSDKSEAQLTELLSTIRSDLRTDGSLDNLNTRQTLTVAVNYVKSHHDEIRDNIITRYASIDEPASVPNFEDFVFNLDTVAPTITNISPGEGTQSQFDEITIHFSELMVHTTLVSSTIMLTGNDGNVMPGSITASDEANVTIVTWAPHSSLPTGAYTLTVGMEASDYAGNGLVEDVQAHFSYLSVTPTQTPTMTPTDSVAYCQINYVVGDNWGNGFLVDVTLINRGSATWNGWSVTWTFGGNQQIVNLWNGNVNQSGQNVQVADVGWNGQVAAGASTTFGFQASYSGANVPPVNLRVNGIDCVTDSEPTNTPTPTSTSTSTMTPTITPTMTPTPTSTATSTSTPTMTPTMTPTSTLTPTATSTFTPTATLTPTVVAPGEMVYVSSGTFQMGCGEGDPLCGAQEFPLHTVYLDPYFIDKYEVTNAQYKACVDAGECTPPSNTSSPSRPSYFGNPEYDNHPVIWVSWEQGNQYCLWADKRLPTEAEWEKAARGSIDTRIYPWGNQPQDCSLANRGCSGDTTAVGSYPAGASPYGAMDMAGNVQEWVSDWYDADYYATSPANNPHGPATSTVHGRRDGAFDHYVTNHIRTSERAASLPTEVWFNFGIRCARTPDDPPPSPPLLASSVVAGITHNCAIVPGGIGNSNLACWGDFINEQRGNGTSIDSHIPVTLSQTITGVMSISAGYHTCILDQIGNAQCWGTNEFGQLGDGTTVTRSLPVDVTGLISDVKTLATGAWHTCALTYEHKVQCWGRNSHGQLGDGTTVDRHIPIDVTGLITDVKALATGGEHTCVVYVTGQVACWGANYNGQLGDGTTIDSPTPVIVAGLPNNIESVIGGHQYSCALSGDGGVKCWGYNLYGQLGDGTQGDANHFRLSPVDVIGLTTGVTAIAGGYYHVCALTDAGGVKCWGFNNPGQLGDGTAVDRLAPVDVIGLTAGIKAITGGYTHTCALTNEGHVKCWGSNLNSQLGDGTTTDRLTPVDVVWTQD